MAITHTEAVRFMDDLGKGSNLFGALSPEVRIRLFNVVDKPSQATWTDAHGVILTASTMTTLWQALLAHTDYDVTSGPSHAAGEAPGPWPQLPTSEQLLVAIRSELTSAAPDPGPGATPADAAGPLPMTIDDMIEKLAAARRESPLGGGTVIHWVEPHREHTPITGAELETDDDGAMFVITAAW